jgi:hypothetical protein
MILFLTILSLLMLVGSLLVFLGAVVRPIRAKIAVLLVGSSLMTTSVVLVPLFLRITRYTDSQTTVSADTGATIYAAIFASPAVAIGQLAMGLLFLGISLYDSSAKRLSLPRGQEDKLLTISSFIILAEGLVSICAVLLHNNLKW